MSDAEVRHVAAQLHGFDVVATGERLTAWLKEHPRAPKIQRKLIGELVHQARTTLLHMTPYRLADIRWRNALQETRAALAILATWKPFAEVRIHELHIDANHSSISLRKSLNKSAARIDAALRTAANLAKRLSKLPVQTDEENPGDRLARWQAMLERAGFSSVDVVSFFKPPSDWPKGAKGRPTGLKDNTEEARRKRVQRYLKTKKGREHVEFWFSQIQGKNEDG